MIPPSVTLENTFTSPQEVFAAFLDALATDNEELLSQTLILDDYVNDPSAAMLPSGTLEDYKAEMEGLSIEKFEPVTDCFIYGANRERVELECMKIILSEHGMKSGSMMVMKLNGSWILVDT